MKRTSPVQIAVGDSEAASDLVRLLNPASWIPSSFAGWTPVIETLLHSFLAHFDRDTLGRLLAVQRALPEETAPAERAARLAMDLTALHKVCQILARNPCLPSEVRSVLTPLEQLPPSEVPDEALSAAIRQVERMTSEIYPDPEAPKIGRGSVADVFRFRRVGTHREMLAFKAVRAEAIPRVTREASILASMADQSELLVGLAGEAFSITLGEALRDASRALLREIDFAGEAANLRDAREFYCNNDRVRVPALLGPPMKRGVLMEYMEGLPLMAAPLSIADRREAARLCFRALFLEPVFAGVSSVVFHADPHAGNILVQHEQRRGLTLVFLDWSQADRLPQSLCHALIELIFYCVMKESPPIELLGRLLDAPGKLPEIEYPCDTADPLAAAFEILHNLATAGCPVPLCLLLLRKSFLTLEGIARELNPCFDPWKEAQSYATWVAASEMPFRVFGAPFFWMDQPEFYRSGLSSRKVGDCLFGMSKRLLCKRKKSIDFDVSGV